MDVEGPEGDIEGATASVDHDSTELPVPADGILPPNDRTADDTTGDEIKAKKRTILVSRTLDPRPPPKQVEIGRRAQARSERSAQDFFFTIVLISAFHVVERVLHYGPLPLHVRTPVPLHDHVCLNPHLQAIIDTSLQCRRDCWMASSYRKATQHHLLLKASSSSRPTSGTGRRPTLRGPPTPSASPPAHRRAFSSLSLL